AMADLAVSVARQLNLDIAGIDILFDQDGYKICEANSAPGFQGLERACAINVPELIFHAMGKKFGIPVRHSERWEQAIDKAARALLKPMKTPKLEPANEHAPASARRRRKPA
ncbi:MAG: hypothetical protein DCF16_04715, partial [Alphaproteobacteria bacterium]